MTSTSDSRLLEAHDLARAALREITPEATIGAPAGHVVHEGGAVSLRFDAAMLGYPGWHWTVSVAAAPGEEPTVLEVELLPGDDALLAPEWIPWSQRLEEYKAAQVAAADDQANDDDDDDDDADDEFDEDGSSILHAGDVDGVDIDELDDESDDDDHSDDDDDDDESDDDDASDGDDGQS